MMTHRAAAANAEASSRTELSGPLDLASLTAEQAALLAELIEAALAVVRKEPGSMARLKAAARAFMSY